MRAFFSPQKESSLIMFLRSPFSLLILVAAIITAFCFLPAVRSDQNLLRLKLDDAKFCSKTAMPDSCPINCFRADPVCGVDGATYWCGCPDAHCAGTTVAKLGACDGNNSSVSGQALLLINIVWLILLAAFVLFGLL